MLRGLLAILAGFGLTAVMWVVFAWMASALMEVPTDAQTTAYSLVTILIVFVSTFSGGMLTGNLALFRPVLHGIGLAVLLLLLLLPMLIFGPRLGQPDWYPMVMVLACAGGAILGSYVIPRVTIVAERPDPTRPNA
jgi:putative membrane protein (TIGR04086 family)